MITKEQIDVWQKLRHKLGHGQILDYQHEDANTWSETLLDMTYGLALRQIGYEGEMWSYQHRHAVLFK